MKKKYTLTIANSDINIITEEPKETIDAIVGIVDRKIREIYLHSKGECSRTNAAILVCLDYCAEKLEMQKTLKNLNAEIERLTMLNEVAEREKAALEREIEVLKAMNASAPKASAKKTNEDQIRLDEIPEEPVAETVEETIETPVAEATEPDAVAKETLTPSEEEPATEKPTVKLKKKKVRAMFDMISFDDI
ncbi:MAG: cell division protein ZapA [Clostridia bacterium]|nr:cell division protein ZapA [Clostridia bacterium]